MNVLFDANEVLDALLDRAPRADVAVTLFERAEPGDLVGHLGATTVTTIPYIARRNVGIEAAENILRDLLSLVEVTPVKYRRHFDEL